MPAGPVLLGKAERVVLDCRTFEEQIGEYLEQGLTVPQRRVFCQHLLICSDCRALLEDIRENLQLCRAAVQPTLVEDDEAAVEKAEVEPGRQVAIRYLPPPVQELSIPRSTIGEMVSCRSFDKLIADYFDSPAVDNLPVASPGSDWPDLSHPQQNWEIHFTAHLLDCAACATLFEGLRQAPAEGDVQDHQQAQLEARIIAATAGIRL